MGMTVAAGGFGLCGIPEILVAEIRRRGTTNLTVISNNCGVDDLGLGVLLKTRQIRRVVASYIGENTEFERQLRAGGAGIPAFFTATGFGTPVGEGKETREFNGRQYILEHALQADFSIIRGWKADWYGNVIYRHTASNFNPAVATAGRITVLEVEESVAPGTLDPAQVHTPGIYIDRLIQGHFEKRIENRTVRKG